jgi:hypothetical protein
MAPVSALAFEPNKAKLISAPKQIYVQKKKLIAEAYLWRDFMPGSPPDRFSLMASIKLKSDDVSSFATDIKVLKVWLLRGKDVWSTENQEVRIGMGPANEIEIVIRNAPKWNVGSYIDVVVKLTDKAGRSLLLKAPAQKIEATS